MAELVNLGEDITTNSSPTRSGRHPRATRCISMPVSRFG
ncbi:hypothetical protein BZL29_7379 [Mycobacterium kansasii]|uniref:Uncharacterized protein n=1 Tax=Mycobacterium kansasii TaxID=1768 RepID=A0A1V3WIX2_MYCKA|nr:hypothetical protein BZL29_7379 [Mycobacterium kansasii]